ncbi:MAG: replicative DNA helicase [Planctomycetota bacterium]|nr:replicative DNA helicase [Planctomycetota bacterium]MDA1142098.1 replicative DNA helicase [Planctomycetota bacterium]
MSDQVPLEKAPPHDEDAERSLLGSFLLDYESCSDYISSLRPESFYFPDHRRIFQAVQSLFEQAKPIDAVLVHEQLIKEGHALPAEYIVGLMEAVPSAAHAEHYHNIVRDKSVLRAIIKSCTEIVAECYIQSEDSEKLLDRAGEMLLNLASNRSGSQSLPIAKVLQETFDRIERLKRGEVSGLRTGYHQLDQMSSGLQPSELIIVAGRPSMGKTSFAMNIAANIAMHQNAACALFSLEVNSVQLAQNMLCAQSRVNAHLVRAGQLTEYDLQRLYNAVGQLADSPIFIQDTASLTIADLRAQARRLKAQNNLGVIFIDYLQLMDVSSSSRNDGRVQEISTISRGLKSIARELEVPVVALSQLSRAVESREGNRPRMSDLRESGSIEQDADMIMLLYREGYYKQDEEDNRTAEVIIAKQRNGPTGSVRLIFNREYMRFDNPTAEDIM